MNIADKGKSERGQTAEGDRLDEGTTEPGPSSLLGGKCEPRTDSDATKPLWRHPPFQPRRGDAQFPRWHHPRVDEHPAGARLHPHRRHTYGHWALYRAAAARCVRGLWLLPPSGRGRGLGHGGHLRQFAFSNGSTRQREVHGTGRHGGAADRRVLVSGVDFQAGVPRRFPLTHGAGRVSHRCRVSSRHRDARRHDRCHGPLAAHARSGVGDHAGPAADQSSDAGVVHASGGRHPARQSRCPAMALFAVRGSRGDRGERRVRLRRARHRDRRSGRRGAAVDRATPR